MPSPMYYILSVMPTSTSTRAGKKDEHTLKYSKEGQLREQVNERLRYQKRPGSPETDHRLHK